jgi:ATP-dependent protease ClpP protease subunit
MNHNRLFNLFARNAKKGAFRAEANTIYVYDVIVSSDAETEYWGGVSPEAFSRALSGMTGPVSLRINSPGGDVFAARAMAAAMRDYSGEITAYVDGYAASAASLIAVSASRALMADGAFMMIHKAWTFAIGNSADLVTTAALLEKIDGTLAETYARKSGGNVEEFAQKMADETWYSAQEAVDAGLADGLQNASARSSGDDKHAARNAWDLSAYDRAPTAAPIENTIATPPAAVDDEYGRRVREHSARMAMRTV